jgi:hypothetical protein
MKTSLLLSPHAPPCCWQTPWLSPIQEWQSQAGVLTYGPIKPLPPR